MPIKMPFLSVYTLFLLYMSTQHVQSVFLLFLYLKMEKKSSLNQISMYYILISFEIDAHVYF